jgi:hypothetical protein
MFKEAQEVKCSESVREGTQEVFEKKMQRKVKRLRNREKLAKLKRDNISRTQ